MAEVPPIPEPGMHVRLRYPVGDGRHAVVVATGVATLPKPPNPKVIPIGDDGQLTCECGNTGFKENGSHPCDWDFESQDAATKTLTLEGEFEWYEGDFVSFECTSCGKDYDALPEGWNTDYT